MRRVQGGCRIATSSRCGHRSEGSRWELKSVIVRRSQATRSPKLWDVAGSGRWSATSNWEDNFGVPEISRRCPVTLRRPSSASQLSASVAAWTTVRNRRVCFSARQAPNTRKQGNLREDCCTLCRPAGDGHRGEGLGDKLVEQLVVAGIVQSLPRPRYRAGDVYKRQARGAGPQVRQRKRARRTSSNDALEKT